MTGASTESMPQRGEVWRNLDGRVREVTASGHGYVQYVRPAPAPPDVLTVSALAWKDWVETTGGRKQP